MTERINIRELALETLLAIREECRQSHFVIREVLERYGWLTDQERAFYLRLTEGTLESSEIKIAPSVLLQSGMLEQFDTHE